MGKKYFETDDPREALRDALALSSRDHAAERLDAWIYGIVLGWDPDPDEKLEPGEDPEDAMREVASLHGWDEHVVARLRRLHQNFNNL